MLLEKAKSPAFWEKVRTSSAYAPLVAQLHTLWENNCIGDIPACKYSEYIVFNQTGSRSEYESPYFHRRRAMNAAALLSLIYPEEEKYFVKLCDVIWAILDEYNWVVPAHIGNFTDNLVAFIDLFAAETGFALSEIDYLLADRLPPLIRSRIAAEIDRRIIAGYTGERRYGWEKTTNNWAAVCMGSVGITVMYRHPELFEELLPRMRETMRCFLSGFPEDGICLEGLGYWHYGFGFFTYFADMVLQFTDGKIDFFDDPKIREIVKHPQRMYLDGGTTVSFSDSGMSGHWHLGTLHYLKNRYPDEIQLPPAEYAYVQDNCARWGKHLRAFLWFDETLEYAEQKKEFTDYAPASQWLIKKAEGYSFAAKGGHNAEPHNHNDVGNFIVTKNGRQVLCDAGAGRYCKQYFSKERYTFFKASSRGHSVPIVDGEYQKAGRQYKAETVFENGIFTLEIAAAYDLPALRSLQREFRFEDDGILLKDLYEFAGERRGAVERFIALDEPKITSAGVEVGGLTLEASTDAVSISEEEGFWCIDYALPSAHVFTLKIKA